MVCGGRIHFLFKKKGESFLFLMQFVQLFLGNTPCFLLRGLVFLNVSLLNLHKFPLLIGLCVDESDNLNHAKILTSDK